MDSQTTQKDESPACEEDPDLMPSNELERQLQHAAWVRGVYEDQLRKLSAALQAERRCKGKALHISWSHCSSLNLSVPDGTYNLSALLMWCIVWFVCSGENNLRLHELKQEVEDLQQANKELQDQVEHWRSRAQEAMEQKAVGAMSSDQQNTPSSVTEEILLDIKKLQEARCSICARASVFGFAIQYARASIYRDNASRIYCRARPIGGSRPSRLCASMRKLRATSEN